MRSQMLAVLAPMAAMLLPAAHASECDVTSVGFTPIDDLGAGLYLNQFSGGLYPGGLNVPPAAHTTEGLIRAGAIEPLLPDGSVDPNGNYVLLSIGMSNTTQEFCSQGGGEPCDPWTFTGQALANPLVNKTTLVIANGARGGQAATSWDSPIDPNYNRVRDDVLAPKGLTEAQVQAIWVKQANPGPNASLPNQNADAYNLEGSLGDIARACMTRYPNLKMIFFSNRIYAGYASTTLNPEPYAYESAFSVKWLIEAQIDQMSGGGVDPIAGDLNYADGTAPWVGWAANLWADGLVPRSDGLTWECVDFANDGTHPAQSGEMKVGTLLLDFFLDSPFTAPWFIGKSTNITLPSTLNVQFGRLVEGTVADLHQSDDSYVIIEQRPAASVLLPLIRIDVGGTTNLTDASEMTVTIETATNAMPSQPPQRLSLRNFDTNGHEILDERITTLSDSQVQVVIDQNAGRFIGPAGQLRTRIDWLDPGDVFSPNWGVQIDQAVWEVTP